jgi:hypothetical protein
MKGSGQVTFLEFSWIQRDKTRYVSVGMVCFGLEFEPLAVRISVRLKRNLNIGEILHFVVLHSILTGVGI